ncbi:hypothetical protein HAV22_26715 [Massilia sp. TW-1]|uniref:Uncharacterized protein n=1 Tax=Telluria antibiotica TaxID=2717319 RepID=A0ABX0PJ62_9BURK|nr:hypothetical protein [Telluria antibiotica]NIA57222.1 hypothetical protein [Telluria antibiotica]
MASAFASSTPAACGRLFIRCATSLLVALLMVPTAAWCQAERTSVATRFGPVDVQALPPAGAGPVRSDIRLRGASLGQVDGDAGLVKLSVHDDADYVLVDAVQPDPQCRHRFTVLQIGPGDEATMSQPFGDCLVGFGARRAAGNLVIQLVQEGAAQPQTDPVVHEFVWMHDRVKELTNVLTRCGAAQATAASRWTPVASEQSARVVTGTGRAWFHTAPLAECKLPALFVIPGDVLTVLHVYGDYADVAYRNPRTGRAATGWLWLDRLSAGAPAPDAQLADPERH